MAHRTIGSPAGKKKKKKEELSLAPGFTRKVVRGEETFRKPEQDIKRTQRGDKEGSITIRKGEGPVVSREEAMSARAFTPEERTTEQQITKGIEGGLIEPGVGLGMLKEMEAPTKALSPQEEINKGVLDSIAQIGLLPATLAANFISTGLKWTTGLDIGKTTTEEVANTRIGKILGLGTAAATSVLAFKFLFPATMAKIGIGGSKGLSAVGVTAKSAGISMQTAAKLNTASKLGIIKTATGFALKHKLAVGSFAFATQITAWLTSDNIITGASIHARDVDRDLVFGNISPGDAHDELDALQTNKNVGTFFMKAAIYSNPALWLFAKAYFTNAKQAQEVIDRARARANLM